MKIVRLKLTVEEIWSPEFADPNSQKYKESGHEIERELESLYDYDATTPDNKIIAHVVQIK